VIAPAVAGTIMALKAFSQRTRIISNCVTLRVGNSWDIAPRSRKSQIAERLRAQRSHQGDGCAAERAIPSRALLATSQGGWLHLGK